MWWERLLVCLAVEAVRFVLFLAAWHWLYLRFWNRNAAGAGPRLLQFRSDGEEGE